MDLGDHGLRTRTSPSKATVHSGNQLQTLGPAALKE